MRKTFVHFFTIADYEEEEAWLSQKHSEGWKFVKWTKDGADYSTDEQITVAFTEEHVEYIAVFDIVE